MTHSGSAEVVTYEPGAEIDASRPLWIARRLTPEGWVRIARVYPELADLPQDACFRSMLLLIMPPEVHDLAGMENELKAVARALQHYFVIQEYFVSGATPTKWAVVCRRGQGIGYLTMTIHRLAQGT